MNAYPFGIVPPETGTNNPATSSATTLGTGTPASPTAPATPSITFSYELEECPEDNRPTRWDRQEIPEPGMEMGRENTLDDLLRPRFWDLEFSAVNKGYMPSMANVKSQMEQSGYTENEQKMVMLLVGSREEVRHPTLHRHTAKPGDDITSRGKEWFSAAMRGSEKFPDGRDISFKAQACPEGKLRAAARMYSHATTPQDPVHRALQELEATVYESKDLPVPRTLASTTSGYDGLDQRAAHPSGPLAPRGRSSIAGDTSGMAGADDASSLFSIESRTSRLVQTLGDTVDRIRERSRSVSRRRRRRSSAASGMSDRTSGFFGRGSREFTSMGMGGTGGEGAREMVKLARGRNGVDCEPLVDLLGTLRSTLDYM